MHTVYSIGPATTSRYLPTPSWLFTPLAFALQDRILLTYFLLDVPAVNSPPLINSLRSFSPNHCSFNHVKPKKKYDQSETVSGSASRTRHADPSTQIETCCAQDLCGLQLLPMYVPFIVSESGPDWPASSLSPACARRSEQHHSLTSFLARKLKCDGGKPQCQQCIRRKVVCEYDTNVKRRGLARSTQIPDEVQGIDVRDRPLVNPKAVACQFCRSKHTHEFSRYTPNTLWMITNYPPTLSLSRIQAARRNVTDVCLDAAIVKSVIRRVLTTMEAIALKRKLVLPRCRPRQQRRWSLPLRGGLYRLSIVCKLPARL